MLYKNNFFLNREISWLSFNKRVLQEASDPSVPLLERIKFIGIFSNNLDEFFRVRVGTLMRMVQAGVKAKAAIGGSPKKILSEIHDVVMDQRQEFDRVFQDVLKNLKKKQIYIIDEKNLDDSQYNFVMNYFASQVRPRLVPIMVDSLPEFPYLKNQVINLAIRLSQSDNPAKVKYALIEVPADVLPRFLVLPRQNNKTYIIMLDDVIRCGLQDIFSIFKFDRFEAYTVKLTRDAEFDIDDDVTKSFFEKISKSLQQRETGQPVRFVYDQEMPEDLLNFILERNNLQEFENIIPGGRYHNARDFINFPSVGSVALRYMPEKPVVHRVIENHQSLFKAIRDRDQLLHYPYQSFHYIIDLLREAAIDPAVTSIKITLYRVAKNSNVINALINAIKNGKAVTVVMELQARFDEEANIYWTTSLRDAGAHVIDGVPGLKVHAKLCLINRIEAGKKRRYAVIGTGNFNESTARLYSDHALLTTDKRLTREVKKVFDFFKDNYRTANYNHLLVAPFHMRKRLKKLIKNEMDNAQNGLAAYIYLKLNSLVDREMITLLYDASHAGVKIKIIARGICSLLPGVPGISDNIEAISIVDKYLEHSRIFIFANGGKELYFISSADWMIRNLDRRVEVATPVYDAAVQKELKDFFMIQWSDNCKARDLSDQKSNLYRKTVKGAKHRCQEDFYKYLRNSLNE